MYLNNRILVKEVSWPLAVTVLFQCVAQLSLSLAFVWETFILTDVLPDCYI